MLDEGRQDEDCNDGYNRVMSGGYKVRKAPNNSWSVSIINFIKFGQNVL